MMVNIQESSLEKDCYIVNGGSVFINNVAISDVYKIYLKHGEYVSCYNNVGNFLGGVKWRDVSKIIIQTLNRKSICDDYPTIIAYEKNKKSIERFKKEIEATA